MTSALRHLLLLACLALVACRKKPVPIPAKPSAPVISDADKSSIFVPEAPGANKWPFVLLLHGLGGSGQEIAAGLGLAEFAREKRFAFAAPDGSVDSAGRRFWNAGELCCDFSHRGVDDVRRLGDLVTWAIAQKSVDAARVYVVGYSNGGFMAHRLACEGTTPLRAIVSLAAVGPAGAVCATRSAPSVLEVHGDRDPIVPFAGGHLFGDSSMPSVPPVEQSLDFWRGIAGCSKDSQAPIGLDLSPELPGAETSVEQRVGCSPPIVLWKVSGAGHRLPLGRAALEAIWSFLENAPARASH